MVSRLAFLALALAALPACLADRGGSVLVTDETEALALAESCPGWSYYQENVETVIQNQCASCHQNGGGNYRLSPGSALTLGQVAGNYASAVNYITSFDFNNPDENAILGKPLKLLSHPVQVFSSQIDPNYMAMREWVTVEQCAPCGSGVDVNTCFGDEGEDF